jgi:integrase
MPHKNIKSVQEVSKHDKLESPLIESKNSPVHQYGKTDSRYWKERLFRNAYTRGKERREVSDWCIKIAYAGRRETLNLRSPNQAVAAARAVDVYKMLIGEGWEMVTTRWKPKAIQEPKAATVGEFIAAASQLCTARTATIENYARSLRQIVADVANVARTDPGRFDGYKGGARCFRERVEMLPLSILTLEKIHAWRLARLRAAGDSPLRQRATKTSVNATVRQAKSLYSRKIIRYLDSALVLPPNPFAEVEFFERGSMRYESKINAPALIKAARSELGKDGDKLELWKAFVLLMFAGLRRNEVDKLRWASVDFGAALIRIEDHDAFRAKCEASKGSVELDGELVAMMRGWRALDPKGVYVLRSDNKPLLRSKVVHYRAERIFDALGEWLKGQGITARKPLHELRKEAGSLVAQNHGIYAASRFLRHADIGITSAHYVDKKERITLGLGALLGEETLGPEITLPSSPAKVKESSKPKTKHAA